MEICENNKENYWFVEHGKMVCGNVDILTIIWYEWRSLWRRKVRRKERWYRSRRDGKLRWRIDLDLDLFEELENGEIHQ